MSRRVPSKGNPPQPPRREEPTPLSKPLNLSLRDWCPWWHHNLLFWSPVLPIVELEPLKWSCVSHRYQLIPQHWVTIHRHQVEGGSCLVLWRWVSHISLILYYQGLKFAVLTLMLGEYFSLHLKQSPSAFWCWSSTWFRCLMEGLGLRNRVLFRDCNATE